eukprot:TRINITY_DN1132_c0_g1_i2.p1 TRINITY_DN1132_c0_g1~~TRINITY_DN1132_c0_g1_i2.p1  ORF type:complete len:480 (+),score=100.34 TRINITY_DN1132_c0_g1_i2:63-1502(+)
MGAPEHPDHMGRRQVLDDPTGAMKDKRTTDEDTDSDEEEETVMIEKTKEQLHEEAKMRWMTFHYPEWSGYFFWFMFACCISNVVLTLDQWHGTHAWRQPFDVYPANKIYGGWEDDQLRIVGSIIGIVAAVNTVVQTPSADTYKVLFMLLLVTTTLLSIQFGKDLYHLNRAVDLPECNQINDMKTNKYICDFTPFRATCIFDILSAGFTGILAFFTIYQSLSGIVSRRKVFNEQNHKWEKITLMPHEPYYAAFPKKFKRQLPFYRLLSLFSLACNAVLIGLTATQTTSDFLMGPQDKEPRFNIYRNTPRDLYVIQGDEWIRHGGWPEANFDLRLATNAFAIVILAFGIQWVRTGRFTQLIVILSLMGSGVMYLSAFAIDLMEYRDVINDGCSYQEANFSKCVYYRYQALIILDGLCGFILFLFGTYFLVTHQQQCARPREVLDSHPYGWWFYGEWEAKRAAKARLAAMGAGNASPDAEDE